MVDVDQIIITHVENLPVTYGEREIRGSRAVRFGGPRSCSQSQNQACYLSER